MEYKAKFKGISNNKSVDEITYNSAVEILRERNGSNKESLYLAVERSML